MLFSVDTPVWQPLIPSSKDKEKLFKWPDQEHSGPFKTNLSLFPFPIGPNLYHRKYYSIRVSAQTLNSKNCNCIVFCVSVMLVQIMPPVNPPFPMQHRFLKVSLFFPCYVRAYLNCVRTCKSNLLVKSWCRHLSLIIKEKENKNIKELVVVASSA